MNIILEAQLEKIQQKLNASHKAQRKVSEKKSHIAIGLGKKDYNGIGLYQQKQILKKTKKYLRIGKVSGSI